MEELLTDEQIATYRRMFHMPMGVADAIRSVIREELRSQAQLRAEGRGHLVAHVAPHWDLIISQDLAALIDYIGGAERIATTHMPFAHVAMVEVFATVWLFTFPLAISDSYPFFIAIPICAALSFILLKTDDTTTQISMPFGEDVNSLPLEAVCVKIEMVLLEIAKRAAANDVDTAPSAHPLAAAHSEPQDKPDKDVAESLTPDSLTPPSRLDRRACRTSFVGNGDPREDRDQPAKSVA